MYRISFAAGPLKGKRLTIREEVLCVGSGPECALRLMDPDIAPRHAEIREADRVISIRILDPSATVTCNGKPAGDAAIEVRPGHKVVLGGHMLLIETLKADPAYTPSARRAAGLSTVAGALVLAVLLTQAGVLFRSMQISQALLMPFDPGGTTWKIEVPPAAPGGDPPDRAPPQQYAAYEINWRSRVDPGQPEDVELTVRFNGPDGASLEVPGFWSVGRMWKVRVCLPSPGPWHYATRAKPPLRGLDGRRGGFTALPAEGEHAIARHGGILKVADGGRHLAHADGTPFFWLGDTWWFCPSDLMPLETAFRRCVETRAAQGYSVVQMCFLGGMDTPAGRTDPIRQAREGVIVPAYWNRVDEYVRTANAHGLIPVIGLAFHSGLDGPTLEQWQRMWRYVVARLGSYAVGFLIVGEYNGDHPGDDLDGRVDKALALGRFIREIDPYKRALTIHPWHHARDRRQAWAEPWHDVIMLQGGHGEPPPVSLYLDAWRQTPPRPVLEAESRYEGVRGATADDAREAAWRAVMSGACGYTYGSHGLWYPTQSDDDRTFEEWGPPTVWPKALVRPGGAQMAHLRAAMEAVEWWRLDPAPDAVRTADPLPERRRILARSDRDRTWLVYFPRGNPPALAAHLAGAPDGIALSAEWFDPRTGGRTRAAGDLRVGPGGAALPARPDANDWVLILRRADTAGGAGG